MVATMTATHHGFAFSWNDGDHSSGVAAGDAIAMWYPQERFAQTLSYPAFGHSSIDDDLGSGDPADGDLVGGINLGFSWTDPVEDAGSWSCSISNMLAAGPMTVDVTPRRTQAFSVSPGASVDYTDSQGGSGTVVADENGLVTVPGMSIAPGQATTLTLTK